jgi:hypothetical protein
MCAMSPKDISVIPRGYSCYSLTGKTKKRFLEEWGQEVQYPETIRCPYWYPYPPGHPEEDAYCEYLDSIGEYNPDGCHVLLWDQCKECDVNLPDEED